MHQQAAARADAAGAEPARSGRATTDDLGVVDGEALAAAPPAQRAAALLRLQGTAGNAAVQRAVRARAAQPMVQRVAAPDAPVVQRDREAPASLRPRLTRDALYEQMAHEFAYLDDAIPEAGMTLLERFQYTPRPVTAVHGQNGFQLRTFHPTSPDGPTPVVAFRGTQFELSMESTRDLGADMDAGGIGMEQFFRNAGLAERWMRAAARAHTSGKVIVCGHSLGGALAQIAAATYPDLIEQVVTFQSPGINRDLVERMSQHNRAARGRGERGVGSTHYRAMGDIVPNAGQGFTPGTIHNISLGMTDPVSAHRAFITTSLAGQQRSGLPLAFGGLPGGEDWVSHAGSESTAHNNSEFRITDTLRQGAGVLGGIMGRGGGLRGAGSYLLEQRQLAEMQRVWLAIQAAESAGRADDVEAIIEGSVLNAANKARIAEQARMSPNPRRGS